MTRRQPARSALPRLWLMTDERMGEGLWIALARLPRGAGVVFRHHATAPAARRALFDRVRRHARARGLMLVLAGPACMAKAWGADGAHGRGAARRAGLVRTAPVHDLREMAMARRAGADLLFLSPVFATRSHPGAVGLGVIRFGLMARRAACPVVALGGMTRARAIRIRRSGAYGWAAIDGLSG